MSSWIHLSLNFKNYEEMKVKLHDDVAPQEKPGGIYKELIHYLKNIVDSLLPNLLNRYFFLFESNPHLFLALEINDIKDIDLIKKKVNQIEVANFIDSVKIDLNSSDENNGEAAIDFFHMATKYAFFRISENYKPGYNNNDEIKLVHCLCNQLFCDWNNEIIFYIKCLQHRGVQIQRT